MKRRQAVGVANRAGFTKALQTVKLDSNIKLVDSPGVILNDNNDNESRLALRNALKVQDIDPYETLEYIFKVVNHDSLLKAYNMNKICNSYKAMNEFLKHFCDHHHLLTTGGIPDLSRACDRIINDWNNGKIPFYVEPPILNTNDSVKFVNSFDNEFDINKLLDQYNNKLMNIDNNNNNNNNNNSNNNKSKKNYLVINEDKFVINNDDDSDMKYDSNDDDMNMNDNSIIIDDEIKKTDAFINA